MTTKHISEESREWMAEAVWLLITYPVIKSRAERIRKQIEDLEKKSKKDRKE